MNTTSSTSDSHTPEKPKSSLWGSVREILVILAIALVISFVVKTFFFRAFYIPSGSMENTLNVQDRVFVNLMRPGLFSIERGDIVVFSDEDGWLADTPYENGEQELNFFQESLIFIGLMPDPSEQHLIKRIIGMPGDVVECCGESGKITVNGEEITETYIRPGSAPSDFEFSVTVPEGSLWVMGDNRDHSADSRYHMHDDSEGFVKIENVTGRAELKVWPLDSFGGAGNARDVFEGVASNNQE